MAADVARDAPRPDAGHDTAAHPEPRQLPHRRFRADAAAAAGSRGERRPGAGHLRLLPRDSGRPVGVGHGDRKSTRLNSSHVAISYAVFCLKKTNTKYDIDAV